MPPIPDILFYVFAIATLVFGALVVANPLSRNPVTSAMFLVLTIISMAGLFVLLNAFFLAAVQVLEKIGGAETLISALQSVGITTLTRPVSDYGLGLTIGGGEVMLLELANAYATLARRGLHQPAVLMESLVNAANAEQVFDPISCYLLADMLADNDARARSFGTRSSLRMAFPVAVKTGSGGA